MLALPSIHQSARNPRLPDPHIAQILHMPILQRRIQHDPIRIRARPNDPRLTLHERRPGRRRREALERLAQRQRLFSIPPLLAAVGALACRWIPPRHGRVHAPERIRRLHRKIAAEHRAQVEDGAHAIRARRGATRAEPVLGVAHVRGGVRGLDGGREADAAQAGLVQRVDDLGVLDPVPLAPLLGPEGGRGVVLVRGRRGEQGGGEGGDGVAVREVADGVDVDLKAGRGPGRGKGGEGRGVDEEGARGVWCVGVGV